MRGSALEEDRGRSVHQWAVHDVGVTRDPADVGDAPEYVARPVIEDNLQLKTYVLQGDTAGSSKPPVDFKNKSSVFLPGLVWHSQAKAELMF